MKLTCSIIPKVHLGHNPSTINGGMHIDEVVHGTADLKICTALPFTARVSSLILFAIVSPSLFLKC